VATQLLTESDLDCDRVPELQSPHWKCSVAEPTTGGVCTSRPHHDEQHEDYQSVQGVGRSIRLVSWIGDTERAVVVDGYTWIRVSGTSVEVPALTGKPLALRYRRRRT